MGIDRFIPRMTRPAHGFPGSHNPIGGEKRREPSLVTEPVSIICNENAIFEYAILDLHCFLSFILSYAQNYDDVFL